MTTTHSSDTTHDVVVGVDGSPASVSALRYALQEAARLGQGVHAVHVVPSFVPVAPGYTMPFDELADAGRAALHATLDEVAPPESVPLHSTLLNGNVPSELAVLAREARVVVVGSDRRSRAARLLTGNASTAVAASSPAPVVAVPETWPTHGPTGVVLVGIKRSDRSDALLAEAFEVARARGARLLVLHAWQLPTWYDDFLAERVDSEWHERAQTELAALLAPWRRAYPDVDVDVRTLHDQAAHALVHASAEADEVVVVRRPHGVPAALHLGPTARAVLSHAHCPVRIVPAERRSAGLDLVLEEAGAVRR